MQEQKSNLSQILAAALSENLNIRTPAEQELQNMLNISFSGFLFELSKILSNENEENNVRQLSATLLKNKIKDYKENWFNLEQNIKEQIKNNILSTLITPKIDVKKASALCISGICLVDLPNNHWTNIFDILINASQDNNIDVKITAVITLGYIYEEFTTNNIYIKISNDTIIKLTNMYYSLLTVKNENEKDIKPLIINCLKSLKMFIPYIEGIISNDNSRLVFLNMINQYMLNNDEEIRAYSVRIFIKLIETYYKYFQSFIDTLMKTLFQIIENDSDNNKKLSLEVLCTIGEYEISVINSGYNSLINYYFLNKFRQKISQIILKYIITNNFDDEDEHTVSKYCILLTVYMSQCCEFSFTKDMINYYKNNISSNNPVIKLSALNIFRAILEANCKVQLFPIIQESLPMLSSILLETQTILTVRKLIAQIMKTITKNFGNLIVKNKDLFDKFMALFLNLLRDSQREIVFIILESIDKLIKRIETNENLPTNLLSQYSNNFYEALLSLAQNINLFNFDTNVPMMALFTIGSFGQHVANDSKNILCNVFSSLVNMFLQTLKKNSFKDEQIRLNYQEYICISCDSFLRNKTAHDRDVRNLFNYIIQSFQQRQDIYEEGINLIGGMAFFFQRGFISEINQFNSYLIHGLNLTNSFAICKASLLCLDEIISNIGPDFNVYVGEYIKIILNILSDSKINRELKPKCFGVISQLFLCCQQETFKFFDDIIKMIGNAIEVCQLQYDQEKDNIDFNNYMMELKESILEAIMCMFNAIKDIGKIEPFIPYVKKIVEFINKILKDKVQINDEIIKNSLGLIASFCETYGKNIVAILKIDLLKDYIEQFKNKLNNENDIDNLDKDFIIWVQKAISDVLTSI